MDPLTQLLVERQMGAPDQTGAPTPTVMPNPTTKIPQKDKRFQNAQQIQDAYRNGWNPNPILLRAQLGHK